jgi:hypothetical protein
MGIKLLSNLPFTIKGFSYDIKVFKPPLIDNFLLHFFYFVEEFTFIKNSSLM